MFSKEELKRGLEFKEWQNFTFEDFKKLKAELKKLKEKEND